jgi:hypothetical protein
VHQTVGAGIDAKGRRNNCAPAGAGEREVDLGSPTGILSVIGTSLNSGKFVPQLTTDKSHRPHASSIRAVIKISLHIQKFAAPGSQPRVAG